ncbi:MAG: ATP-binding protein, partial [Bacteroidota bacterium]
MYDNSLHRILEDNDGRFWINTNRGIFWVQRDELNAYIAGERLLLTSVAYTEADGMRNQEGNGGVQSAGTRTADGKLWFPTLDGVVVIDPAQVPLPMPQAVIESVRVEDVVRPLGNALVLTAKERDMSFALLGVEPNQPEDVHLQYRLVGYDETWHAAGAQWVATYTNLEPGTYQFEARAGLGGVWSVPVVKPFDRRALFWETGWFYGLCGVLLMGMVYGGYRYRVRQLEAGQRRLEATVASRTSEIEAQKAQITEQARKLKQANALKSRFLANISHEFRTPLTLTFGPLDDALAGQYGRLPERARPHFERARQNGWRLLRLINQLLDLSRLDAGMNGLQAHRHDLVAFVRQRMAAFESLAAMHSVKLRMETEAPSIPHVFDAEKLETVVLNLLSNAIKFVNEGGAVTVHVAREAEAAVIRVHNTGSFIPLEAQPHLFDRFYQVDGSATRRRDGSGIGLSLVHELVKLHGGEIAVASSADSGTAFTVTLPALPHDEATAWVRGDGRSEQVAVELALPSRDVIEAMPEASAAVEEALPAPPTDGTRPVVLIVEDNADMRAYLRDHLATTYHVEEAEDGVAGLDVAREVVPDLVLSDVMMPRMDGFGLVAALKIDVQTSHIPVVLLTAKGEVDSKIEGLEAGADDYLTKPFNASELRARVANLIAQRRMLRTRYQAEVQAGPPSAVVGLPAPDVAFLEQVEATVQAHLADELFGVEVLA